MYTVAVKDKCEEDIAKGKAEGKPLKKKGMGQVGGTMYRGGAIWETVEQADAFIAEHPDDGLAVFGVLGDLERDTMQYEDESFRRLIVDRELVQLNREEAA